MQAARSARIVRVAIVVVACAALAYPGTVRVFPSSLPLGTEAIVLQPAQAVVYVMASAQSPSFEGLRLVNDGKRIRLLDADGNRLSTYPRHLDFRVTASMLAQHNLGYEPFPIASDLDTDTYLRSLTFRVKMFRGLDVRVLEPAGAHMIGVPADVPHSERTYRVSFELKDASAEDRLAFEVLAPDGQRVARFHLPLN